MRSPCNHSQTSPHWLESMNNMHEAEDTPEQSDSSIDLHAALAMAGGDIGLLRELAGASLDEVPRLLESLRSAVDEHDSESLQVATHQLQGVMRCLHIERALQQARQLELLGDWGTDWQAANELLAELNLTIRSAIDALAEFLGEQA